MSDTELSKEQVAALVRADQLNQLIGHRVLIDLKHGTVEGKLDHLEGLTRGSKHFGSWWQVYHTVSPDADDTASLGVEVFRLRLRFSESDVVRVVMGADSGCDAVIMVR